MTVHSESAAVSVAMWPRWNDHPYLEDLKSGLAELDVDVVDATRMGVLRNADVLHVQWPDAIWSGGWAGRLVRLLDVGSLILAAVIRRRARVVTVHNLVSHESTGRFGNVVVRAVLRVAARVIVLSESGRDRFLKDLEPRRDPDEVDVIELMDWSERYAPVSASRAAATLPDTPPGDGLLIGWFGLIRPYKGVDGLIDLVADDDPPSGEPLRLMLLGQRRDAVAADGFADTVAKNTRMTHIDRHVSDEEIVSLCSLADAMVFPFLRVENSASVVTALAAGAIVIAPRIGALVDLEPHPRLSLYEGALSVDVIRRAIAADRTESQPASGRSRLAIARQHRDVYARVIE